MIIENRPGAGGTIGAGIVAKSPPDGYTLLVNSAAQAYNPSIYPNLPYDTAKDFVEIAPLAGQPNVLVVAPATGYKTVADLIAAAKAKPGAAQLRDPPAPAAARTSTREKFRLAAGIDVVHIPYKGTPEALTDTMTGRVTYFFSPISAALPNVREGKLVALAVSTAKRSSALPNVPTIAESGVPGFDYNLWVGHVRAGRHACGHRRQDRAGRGPGAAVAGSQGAAVRPRRGADADDARGIPQVRHGGDRRCGEGHQGGGHQGAMSCGGQSLFMRKRRSHELSLAIVATLALVEGAFSPP